MTFENSVNAPSLLTEMRTADIPATYQRFADVVGDRNWTHRAAQIRAAIKHNRFLDSYLRSENEVAFGLDDCGELIKRYCGLPNDVVSNRGLYPAISFAAQSMSMMDLATPVEAERLRKRVAGAFQNPDDMRALRLELTVATHFARRGHQLQWPEMAGSGTFDLLVTDIGKSGVEVECKSISNDKGRKIHRHEALEFHHLMIGELAHIRKTLRLGLAVVLTVPDRLPTRYTDRLALAKRTRRQITLGQGELLQDGSHIRITEFDLSRLGDIAKDRRDKVARQIIQDVTNTQNREGMLMSTDAGGALAFVVQSAIEDDFLDATFKRLSEAAKWQLSRSRPALLMAGFDGLDGDQLNLIAEQDKDANQPPTALAIKVSRFLAADYRDYVVGVGFLSRGALRPLTEGVFDNGGTAYYFPKRESSFWCDDLGGLFQRRTTPYVEGVV